jgi:hypothetical protein
MEIFPEPLSLPTQIDNNSESHNLGYATFSSPMKIDFHSVADGTWIMGTNTSLRLIFCSPGSAVPNYSAMEFLNELLDEDPHGARELEANAHKSLFERKLEEENTELQSNIKIVTMGRSEFKSYLKKLKYKSGYRIGFAGVHTFTNSRTKGIVWVGEEKDDYSNGSAYLESTSGNIGLYIHFDITSENSIESIKPILSSFAFSIDVADSKSSISNLVMNTGIEYQKK